MNKLTDFLNVKFTSLKYKDSYDPLCSYIADLESRIALLEQICKIQDEALTTINIDVFVADYATEYRLSKKQAIEAQDQITKLLEER